VKLSARDAAVLAVGAVLLYGIQIVLAALPNIEGVSLIIILLTVALGWRAMWSVVVFVVLQGLTYGFGLWWFFYMYVWPLLVVLVMAFRRGIGDAPAGWALFSAGFGLLFGLFYAVLMLFVGGWSGFLAAWIAGFPFDIAHCIGNFVVCLALYRPLSRALAKFVPQPDKIATIQS